MRNLLLGVDRAGKPVYFDPKLRRYGLHILGRFGLGKSKAMETMIRRDILNREGLLLLDPHGSLYEGVVAWAARKGLLERERVILFEPSAGDWAFGFNPLQVSGCSPEQKAEAIDALVAAFAQVWGGEDLARTPRLARCLPSVLYALAENGYTLNEALLLCDHARSSERRFITSTLPDPLFQQEWAYLNSLTQSQFTEMLESTRSRISAFLRSPVVRTMLSQTKHTIDLLPIMEEGKVVLMNLAKVPVSQKRLLGSLIVSNLFTKALQRKPERSRPFYCYIDEAHQFINSDVGEIITQCRKFGLHLVLSHQNLGQLREIGEAVYQSVLQIPNRMVFGGLPPRDAKEIAEALFMGKLDLERPKRVLDKPVVVGHRRGWLSNRSDSQGKTITRSRSESSGRQVSYSETRTDTDGENWGEEKSTAIAHGRSASQGRSKTNSFSTTDTTSEVDSVAETLGSALSVAESHSESLSYSTDGSGPDQIATNDSETVDRSESESESWGHAEGRAHGETSGVASTRSNTRGRTRTFTSSDGASHGESRSHSQGRSTGHGRSQESGTSASVGDSVQHSEGRSETLIPNLRWMPASTYSLEEQLHLATAALVNQDPRQAFVRFADRRLEQITTPHVKDTWIKEAELEAAKRSVYQRTTFALPRASAELEISTRQEQLREAARRQSLLPMSATGADSGDDDDDNYRTG
jgi:type IV secretion system coupling TraD/TrwB family protein